MSTVAEAPVERKKLCPVNSFGVEADNQRNADLLIQSLSGMRLRSSIKATKMVFSMEQGEQVQMPAPANMTPGLPANIPGMQLHVDTAKGVWKVYDPLSDDTELCEKIKRAIDRNTSMRTTATLRGVPTKSGRLNPDQMKTLAREMKWLVDSGDAKVVQGTLPDEEAIECMAGEYLTNPLNLSNWHQPRYEKDVSDWEQTLNRLGAT